MTLSWRRPRWLPEGGGWTLAVAAMAMLTVGCGILLGWRGGDMPAQIYRAEAVRHHGLALWDSQWFGGHWTLGYSVAYPALASVVGLTLLSVVSAGAAAAGFDRLLARHFAPAPARAASVFFAVSIVVETAIGQLPFLAGEAAGLWACVGLARRRPALAVAATVLCGALSPLAAAFVALAAGAWLLATWLPEIPNALPSLPSLPSVPALPAGPALLAERRGAGRISGHPCPKNRPARLRSALAGGHVASAQLRRRPRWRQPGVGPALGVLAGVAVPMGIVGLLFPGQGPMPYPFADFAWEIGIAVVLWALIPRTAPGAAGSPAGSAAILRAGIIIFVVAAGASFVIPSALGGNVGRIEDVAALPLATAFLWSRRRWLLALAAIPLILSQWGPAWAPMVSGAGHPWAHAGYYRPLVNWVHGAGGRYARVEVVPTAEHWEAAYVAPTVALARGWERQLDVADNPIFYARDQLDAASYHAWLLDNGVRYVALPATPLDYAGVAEGRLVASGVPDLRLVMHSAHWRVYQVQGTSGIVSGPGYLSSLDGSRVVVVATGAGMIEVRLRDNRSWRVRSGAATIDPTPSPTGWIVLQASGPGVVHLDLGPPAL